MKKTKKLVSFLLILGAFGFSYVSAENYILPYPTVKNKKIEYTTDTKYIDELKYSINLWKNENKVSIENIDGIKKGDLYITDLYLNNKDWAGIYYKLNSTSLIVLNKYYMDGDSFLGKYTWANKVHNISHELGHSLGLDHSIPGNMLYSGRQSYTELGKQDKKDLDYLYGN